MFKERLNYWRRIFKVYLTKEKGYLSFWHERPEAHPEITPHDPGVYYMTFRDKADYAGPKDKDGVILFDYFANIGRQYNPVAIAQYGLGNYNLYKASGDPERLKKAKAQADWLVRHLEPNEKGVLVWKHNFEWHYKKVLAPGWYSALSQGCGISLLVRMHKETGNQDYLATATQAYKAMLIPMEKGGVSYVDNQGDLWLEEYMVEPPTHILNGFLWALWGVWDLYLETRDQQIKSLFDRCLKTLGANLIKYDAGYWSKYDLSKQVMKMLASPFYHKLHIAELRATHTITGDEIFNTFANKFEKYQNSWFKRKRAFIYKAIFKILYF